MFAWIMLWLAGLSEIVWAQSLKLSNGFTKFTPTVIMVIFSIISFYCLALATRTIPLGIAYAIWGGIGELGILLLGYFIYGEIITLGQCLFVALIIVGIIGLKFSS